MIKKIVAVVVLATTAFACAATAMAEDFPAAPMNPGPAKVTGLGPFGDIANVALTPVNAIAVPLLVPVSAAAPAGPVVVRHHRHHWRKKIH